jgi:hypothetical protein
MSEYDNTNRGAIWKNENRQNEKHPQYKGSINVGGVEYWLSAWVGNKDNPKAPALSLSVQAKEEQAKPAKTPQAAIDDFDDDMPF